MLRRFTNTASPKTLTSAIDNITDTLPVGDTADFPDPPFHIAIERGETNEEACLVTSLSGTTLVVERGYDGTDPLPHVIDALVEHVAIAQDYREAHVPSITEAEKTGLTGPDLWNGRQIWNEDTQRLELAYPGGLWDQILPTGAVLPFAGSVAPTGFLMCDGATHDPVDYPSLFSVIGNSFGGDGVDTFVLPDLRQRFPLGKAISGTGSVLGSSGGVMDHTHNQTAHTHGLDAHSHSVPSTNNGGYHAHSQGSTGSAGNHDHGSGQLITTTGGSGHTHNAGGLNTGPGNDDTRGLDGGIHSSSMRDHTHSIGGNTGSTGSGHTHNVGGDTAHAGSHAHSTPNTNQGGNHNHSVGNTGSVGGSTQDGAAGGAGHSSTWPTSVNNPPYLVLNYIIRI